MSLVQTRFDARVIVQSTNDILLAKENIFHSEKDEDRDRDDKTVEEIQMENLLKKLPDLDNIFELRKKIGEGTFSSVYLAALKCQSGLKEREKKLYAIKHLVPTSHPTRIEQELWCLHYIGGSDNVIGVNLCLRQFDTVVFVMPYIPHTKFTDYMHSMDVEETRLYLRALLIALKRVHQFGVIHRDVKPSNFLYDRSNKRFLLVDFGLAQKIVVEERCIPPQHYAALPSLEGRKRKRGEDDNPSDVAAKKQATHNNAPLKLLQKDHPKVNILECERKAQNASLTDKSGMSTLNNTPIANNIESALNLTKTTSQSSKDKIYSPADQNSYPIDYSLKSRKGEEFRTPQRDCSNQRWQQQLQTAKSGISSSHLAANSVQTSTLSRTTNAFKIGIVNKTSSKDCRCYGRPMVCNSCLVRGGSNAPRAGTQGFRPPEVLLKYQQQTTAVDIWACGVTFLSILSGRYPFFKAPDDLTALAELVSLFGTERMQKIASRLGKHLMMSHNVKAVDLTSACRELRSSRQHNQTQNENTAVQDTCSVGEDVSKQYFNQYKKKENTESPKRKSLDAPAGFDFPECAFDLLLRLLDPNPFTRITADLALSHQFLAAS